MVPAPPNLLYASKPNTAPNRVPKDGKRRAGRMPCAATSKSPARVCSWCSRQVRRTACAPGVARTPERQVCRFGLARASHTRRAVPGTCQPEPANEHRAPRIQRIASLAEPWETTRP